MSIWAVTLGLAIVVVIVTRGSFFALARMQLRALWLLIGAVVLQIGIGLVDFPEARVDDLGFGLLMLSYAMLLAFCFANLGLRGMGVITVGIAMNTLVIGLNQGMPTSDDVWRDGELVSQPVEESAKHQPETDHDLVSFLGDIIVLPPPFEESISFGDLVLAIGFVDVVFWGSRKRRRKTAEEMAEDRLAEVAVERRIDLVEAEREEVARPATAPAPISWRPPDEETVAIDLSAYERRERTRETERS